MAGGRGRKQEAVKLPIIVPAVCLLPLPPVLRPDHFLVTASSSTSPPLLIGTSEARV